MNLTHTRRDFLKTSTSVPLAAAIGLHSSLAVADIQEPAALAKARKIAQRRRRRLIYNDDGCGAIWKEGGNTREAFLYGPHGRMGPLKNTQVESVFISSGASHVLNHHSDVTDSYADVAERYSIGGEWEVFRANMRALEDLGTDAIQLTIDYCVEHNLEVFYSHRINDIHNTFLPVERSKWFREHPQYWMGTPAEAAQAGGGNSPKHWWSSLDFEHPEVLDFLYQIQEDACGRYAVDGVEIDYFRSPMFFRPNLEYQPATEQQLEILTGFQRRLRKMHLQVGTNRGRPILTAVRVPAAPEACRHVGIDIQRWLEEGLVDVLNVGGGYIPFTEPLDEIVKLAHDAGVPVQATISASGMRGPDGRYAAVEAWRGAAANMWHAGVDGIVTFNLGSGSPDQRLMDIGSPETLAGRNKLFVIDPRRILEGDLVQGITQDQALPLTIPANGQTVIARLPIGDDLATASRNGILASADLRIRLGDTKSAVELRFNGTQLSATEPATDDGWIVFRPQPDQFRWGHNELAFRIASASVDGPAAEVTHVELPVFYK